MRFNLKYIDRVTAYQVAHGSCSISDQAYALDPPIACAIIVDMFLVTNQNHV